MGLFYASSDLWIFRAIAKTRTLFTPQQIVLMKLGFQYLLMIKYIYYFSDFVRYYYDYECNEPLVANSKLSATSSLRDRGPENAKLYGKK